MVTPGEGEPTRIGDKSFLSDVIIYRAGKTLIQFLSISISAIDLFHPGLFLLKIPLAV